MNPEVKSFFGKDAEEYIDQLAKLRIRVFREWPYLYEGHMAYEMGYLRTFLEAEDGILVLALDGDQVVGASTGMPMIHETENVQKPFLRRGYDLEKIFYYGESVLLPEYRGQGIGVAFFQQREAWARSLDRFDWLTFCAVVRPDTHPLRPKDYVPLDRFWQRRGFEPTDDYCQMTWQDLDRLQENEKELRFWIKRLPR